MSGPMSASGVKPTSDFMSTRPSWPFNQSDCSHTGRQGLSLLIRPTKVLHLAIEAISAAMSDFAVAVRPEGHPLVRRQRTEDCCCQ
jgi:hypothetical protein